MTGERDDPCCKFKENAYIRKDDSGARQDGQRMRGEINVHAYKENDGREERRKEREKVEEE